MLYWGCSMAGPIRPSLLAHSQACTTRHNQQSLPALCRGSVSSKMLDRPCFCAFARSQCASKQGTCFYARVCCAKTCWYAASRYKRRDCVMTYASAGEGVKYGDWQKQRTSSVYKCVYKCVRTTLMVNLRVSEAIACT